MNKKIIQLLLFLILIIISIIFYLNYFQNPSEQKLDETEKTEALIEKQNNLIKNLRYNVNFDDNVQYSITAELSEIFYEQESEFVKMQIVYARITDENGISLIIESDNAVYNNTNYNTKFHNNVRVTYLGNLITAENLNLNFTENIVTIKNNVVYEGIQGQLKSDNVTINLLTKETEIFMDDIKNKVIVESK